MRNATVLVLCSFLLLSATAFGQQNQNRNSNTNRNSNMNDDLTEINLSHSLELENDSRKDEVSITIPEATLEMKLTVYCSINSGKLDIELYDPRGKKQANFSLIAKKRSSQKAKAGGNISKKLRDPLPGEWKLKIMPENVTGDIDILANYKQ